MLCSVPLSGPVGVSLPIAPVSPATLTYDPFCSFSSSLPPKTCRDCYCCCYCCYYCCCYCRCVWTLSFFLAVVAPVSPSFLLEWHGGSPEMGVVKPKNTLPFVLDFVGTYSCHGVEPGMRAGETSAKINQDRGAVCYPFGENPNYTQALFCVYDGHGAVGDKVSHFVMNEMQAQLEAHPLIDQDPEKALAQTFVTVDEKLRKDKSIDAELSGTTAVVCLYRVMHAEKSKVHLWTACAGDSRAVMGLLKDGKEVAQDLSEDQKPDSPGEHARIKKAGGFVSPPEEEWGGPARVWLDANMTLPGLAMARSIGDHLVSSVGVCADPVVKYTTWDTPDDDAADGPWFIVMASDGVWEFIESQQAVSLVGKFIKQQGDATVAVTKLIETAAAKWRQEEGDYRDDITAIVIRMRKLFDQPPPDQI